MDLAQLFIIAGGVLTLLMFGFHLAFPKLFKWDLAFKRIKEPNNKIFYTIHIALYLLFLGMAYISLFYSSELVQASGLARALLVVLAVFWFWRTVWQLIYFKPLPEKPLFHIILTVWFALLCCCYAFVLAFK